MLNPSKLRQEYKTSLFYFIFFNTNVGFQFYEMANQSFLRAYFCRRRKSVYLQTDATNLGRLFRQNRRIQRLSYDGRVGAAHPRVPFVGSGVYGSRSL